MHGVDNVHRIDSITPKTFISGRATRNMDRFAIRRDGDKLIVDVNRLYRSDQQKAEWDAAVVTL